MINLEQKIEAILFFKGEPISIKRLGDILKVSEEEIKDAIFNLKNNLKDFTDFKKQILKSLR